MDSIYIIQDPEKHVWAAAYELEEAIRLCKKNEGATYRQIPFFKSEGTEITVKAGPIEKEYLSNPINADHVTNEKEHHITANGYNPKTGKYAIPDCYVTAPHFMDAFKILSEFLESGAHGDKVRLVK